MFSLAPSNFRRGLYKITKTGLCMPFSQLSVGNKTYLKGEDGSVKSFWHDLPLYVNPGQKVFNMFVEIPRWTNAKNEMSKDELFNPISQEIKDGAPRFVPDIFPFKGYLWNYGAFPQTYEDPDSSDKFTGLTGDGDPIDVVEIGQSVAQKGQIINVKLLGIMGMIDGGETDWKVFAIDVNDPLAPKINNSKDIEKYMPGLVDATRSWFTKYKVPQGKGENSWCFDGQIKDALNIV
ncbi:hypothetical protein BB560_001158 [Smittium megazygosporum]|uniref:inorganic diphosphatase n=1 Tax=Smittium megazygosporum TaxID=133381 RepID=A0A2T9ZIA7_9FUNG|nr:hypothetical protein BB560_001158 [Smittium megazygosporum]